MAKIDINAFREQEALKNVAARPHPTHDLIIWNYTQKCQFEHAWNEVTLQARGLITTSDGTIVARPFRKFFNIDEHQTNVPIEPFKVTTKEDGSLGIVFHWQGEMLIATRGSFVSDQAIKGQQLLQKYADFPFDPAYTYLFEIVYPGNRIVINYGDREDLILLAVIHTETGAELDIHEPTLVTSWPFPLTTHYDGIQDLALLQQLEKPNQEGFVIHFASGLRVKAKFAEYKRLHSILTQCTARTIWEALQTNGSLEHVLERVPDEFFAWVRSTQARLENQYAEIEQASRELYEQVRHLPTRREQAAIVAKHPYAPIVFHMLDGKPCADIIWKRLKPEAERPFREDEE